MKRIALVLVLIILTGTMVVSAEIRTGTDSFTGGSRYTSGNYLDDEKWVGLRKIIDGDKMLYELLFSEKDLKHVKFTQDNGEIKIDNNPINSIIIKETSSMPTINSALSHIRLSATISLEQIEPIKNANRVAFRFCKTDGTTSIIILPDAVLAEWKDVINTEK
ncbi:hypothetical protein [Sporomusa sphaeroides]|uniref:hypothetical protein n=1 Tax=Sporomusa sphaeroides TaxID=47679 RepID=UPI002B706653|nr:hypothetical protein [Sporomusa sphaeroides]HML33858.1 hypothetical protein [Sporomusa sphaeroides]